MFTSNDNHYTMGTCMNMYVYKHVIVNMCMCVCVQTYMYKNI